MTNKLRLDTAERELLAAYERGEWHPIGASPKELQQYQAYATAALEADGLISIILPKEDLQAIRRQAAEAGVSYQALIADIVHRFVVGRLVERRRA